MKLLATIAILTLATASFAQPPTVGSGTCAVLPANHIRNTQVDTLPVSPNSARYINTIGASAELRHPVSFSHAEESDPGPDEGGTPAGQDTAPSAEPSPQAATQATEVAMPSIKRTATATVRSPAPTISSVNPNPAKTGNVELTVTGSNFQVGAIVTLGSTPLATSFGSALWLTASGSTSAAGSAIPVRVTNPDGQVSPPYKIALIADTPVSVSIAPATAAVRVNRSMRFTAAVLGAGDRKVIWQVNGVAGGDKTGGTITSSGLYTAPVEVPSPDTVTVKAVSAADPTKAASATVTIVQR